MSDFRPETLIDQYLAGELDPETAERVRAYLESTPGRRGFMAGIHAAARNEDLAPTFGSLAAARDEFFAKLDTVSNATPITSHTGRRFVSSTFRSSSRSRWLYPVGAVAVLGLALIGLTHMTRRSSLDPSRHYATAAGQRAVVVLPDGSRAILAPNTELSVPTAFGSAARHVTLVGHAQFSVAHTAGVPFTVQTGDIVTRVLGTVFDVQRYAGERTARVAVLSGRVAVRASARLPVTLVAGTVGRIDGVTDSVVTADRSPDLGWTTGTLQFHDTPLPDALDALSRWYGVEFKLSDSAMAQWHVNGTFAGESRAEALLTMQSMLSVGMTFDSTAGGTPVVTIIRRHASHSTAPSGRERLRFPHSTTEVGR